MPLKSIEQHQEESMRRFEAANGPHRTGVACPKCGGELIIKMPYVVLTSNPPQQWATCEKCEHRTTILC